LLLKILKISENAATFHNRLPVVRSNSVFIRVWTVFHHIKRLQTVLLPPCIS